MPDNRIVFPPGFYFTRGHSSRESQVLVHIAEDAVCGDVVGAFIDFLRGCGYAEESIRDAIGDKAVEMDPTLGRPM